MATCPNCRAPITPGAKFCRECGTPVAAFEPAVVANATPAVAAVAAKRRRRLGWKGGLGIVALVLLLGVGSVAAYWGPTLLRGQRTIHAFMPADTQVFVSLNPNLSALKGAQRLQTIYIKVVEASTSVGNNNQRFEDSTGVEWASDIQPWIGLEAAISLTGLPDVGDLSSIATNDRAEIIVVLASRDQAKAEAFLEQLRDYQEDNGARYDDDIYQEVTLYALRSTTRSNPLNAFVAMKDYVIFASSKRLLTETMDRSRTGKNSLKDNTRFQHVVATLPTARIGYAFIDGQWLDTNWNNLRRELRADQTGLLQGVRHQLEDEFTNLKALEGLGFSLALEDVGIQIDAIAQYDRAKFDQAASTKLAAPKLSGAHAAMIGTQSFGFFSLALPPTLKDNLGEWLNGSAEMRAAQRDLQDAYGLDIEQDVLPWLDGEATLVSVENAGPYSFFGSAYLAMRPTDKAQATVGMEAVAESIEALYSGSNSAATGSEQFDGQTWQVMARDYNDDPAMAYGWAGEHLLLAANEAAIHAANSGSQAALASDSHYQAVRAKLPSDLNMLLYVNVPRILDVAMDSMSSDAATAEEAERWLRPVKGIGLGISSTPNTKGTSYSRLFVLIGEP